MSPQQTLALCSQKVRKEILDHNAQLEPREKSMTTVLQDSRNSALPLSEAN